MNQYPKWLLLLLAPTVLIPIGTLVFFLFGDVRLWPATENVWSDVLHYVLLQLFWLGPIAGFFISLFFWGWMRERASIITALFALLLTAASVIVLVAQ